MRIKPNIHKCPNCGMALNNVTGPDNLEDSRMMIENMLHIDGLCPNYIEKATKSYSKLFDDKNNTR